MFASELHIVSFFITMYGSGLLLGAIVRMLTQYKFISKKDS